MHDDDAELHRVDPGGPRTHRDRLPDDRRDQQERAVWFAAAQANIPQVPWNVDDAAAGYASLHYFVEPQPHGIMLDRSLVRASDYDGTKLAVIMGLRCFADPVGCQLIAESTEAEEEQVAVLGAGVRFGQGDPFGRSVPLE
jgi:EAL domain-containing protein (putative c-di-GMP-specific phosphodiesterase class I)